MKFLTTGQVADLLEVPPHRLEYLTRDRKLRLHKVGTGAFIWFYSDTVDAARLLGVPVPSRESFASSCSEHATAGSKTTESST